MAIIEVRSLVAELLLPIGLALVGLAVAAAFTVIPLTLAGPTVPTDQRGPATTGVSCQTDADTVGVGAADVATPGPGVAAASGADVRFGAAPAVDGTDCH